MRRELIVKAKCAALLHDVGHAPFGHALDKLIGYLDATRPLAHPDKHYSRLYLDKYLSLKLPNSVEKDNLSAILGRDRTALSGWDTLIADLLDSSLDVDRMDFLVRDAHMTGLSMGVIGVEALIERMCPFQEGEQIYLAFERSCLPYVEDFLVAREKMYALCYEHPSKLAAERIFTRLVERLIRDYKLESDLVMLLTDEQILALLGLAAVGSKEITNLLYALLQNIEFKLKFEVDLMGNNPQIGQWTKNRDFRRMGHWAYVEAPSQWENTIATEAGLGQGDSWQILVTVPDQKTSIPNETAARVIEPEGIGYRVRPLLHVFPKLLDRLKDAYTPRGRIRVFADSRLTAEQMNEVERSAKELLGHN